MGVGKGLKSERVYYFCGYAVRMPGGNDMDIPTYILEALDLIKDIRGWEDLPSLPPMVKFLPSSKKTTFKIYVNSIIADIFMCMQKSFGVDDVLFGSLFLLFNALPIFIFAGPLREPGRQGTLVSVYKSPVDRAIAFKEEGGPTCLWRDSGNMARYFDSLAGGKKPSEEVQKDTMSANDVRMIEALLNNGSAELGKATRLAFSDFKLREFGSQEDVERALFSKFDEVDFIDRNLEKEIKMELQTARDDGLLKIPGEKGFESLVSNAAMKTHLRGRGPSDQTDVFGWREYHIKQILSWHGDNRDAFEWICNIILTGCVPEHMGWIINSATLMVLDHRYKVGKERFINPPASHISKVAAASYAIHNKASLKEIAGHVQLGIGVSSGAVVGANALNILADETVNVVPERFKDERIVQVVADASSFFYNLSKAAWVRALVRLKQFHLLQAAVVQLGCYGGTVIGRTTGRMRVHLQMPFNGLTVGHPFSPILAAAPVSLAYCDALHACCQVHGEQRFRPAFEKYVFCSVFFDDFHFTGQVQILLYFLRELIPRLVGFGMEDQFIAKFSTSKGFLRGIGNDGEVSPVMVKSLLTVLFGSRQEQEDFFSDKGEAVNVPFKIMGWAPEEGSKYLGGYLGGSDFLSTSAKEVLEQGVMRMARLRSSDLKLKTQLSLLHSWLSKHSHLLSINGGSLEFSDAFQRLDEVMVEYVRAAAEVGEEEWSAVQNILIRLPLKLRGLGMRSILEFAPTNFLVGYAATLDYVHDSEMGDAALLARGVAGVFQNPNTSLYGENLRRSISHFNHLFEFVNGRPMSKAADGCDLSSLENFPTADKLGRMARELNDAYQKKELEDNLQPEDLESWRCLKGAASGRGGVDWFTVVGMDIRDEEARTLLRHRLFVRNVGGSQEVELCPGKPACNSKQNLTDKHAMGCIHIGDKGPNCFLHAALLRMLLSLFRHSGVPFDKREAANHPGLVRRLIAKGTLPPSVRGRHKGGDILAQNVMGEVGLLNSKLEMVVDVTVTSRLGTAEDPLKSLVDAEKEKLKYVPMYDSINVGTEGLAMDVYGNIGPNLRKLIKKCESHWETLGEDQLPSWSNWKCATFERAWLAKFVVGMQVAAASKLNYAKAVVNRRRFEGT